MLKRSLFLWSAVLLTSGLVGCQKSRQSTPGAEGPSGVFKLATGHDVQDQPYRIDPPDELTIHAPKIKEIDNVKQVVRADGKISLNLVGEVSVVGKTTEEITAMLKELTAKYYMDAALDIKVEVLPNSKFFTVFGTSVNAPGKKPYTGHDTVIRALAEAGFNEEAWPQQVRISRPPKTTGAVPETVVVDFTKIYDYGEIKQNYILEEGDIVYVPDGPLNHLNKVLVKLLGPITGASEVGGGARSLGSTGTK